MIDWAYWRLLACHAVYYETAAQSDSIKTSIMLLLLADNAP